MNKCYWLLVAKKELFMQFSFKRQPSDRDFLWLTLLSMLVLLFALLILSTRDGLSERMVDLLLGRVPGHGIPVWVRANPYTKGGQNLIDTKIIHQVNALGIDTDPSSPGKENTPYFQGLSIHPYQEVDHVTLSLPGDTLWDRHGHDPESPRFEGIAISQTDPLWEFASGIYLQNHASAPGNFCIVLNRSIFKTYFHYDDYQASLKKLLPEPLFREIPDKDSFFNDKKKNHIWLFVGITKDLLRLDVIWVDRFPIPGKFAYLFPWHHYHALEKAYQYANIRYFPEVSNLSQKRRVKTIFVRKDVSSEQRDRFSRCLNGDLATKRGQHYISFKREIPEFWVDACAKDTGINGQHYRIAHPVTGDPVRLVSFDTIELPCGKLPKEKLTAEAQDQCILNPQYMFAQTLPGSSRAFVYVPDRGQLSSAISCLKNMEQKPLLIPWIYGDALKRFGALIKIIDVLSSPYFILFILFLIALFGVMIATLIGHRKHYYGIYLAKGMGRRHIYGMLLFQIGMTLSIGLVFAAITLQNIRYLINRHFISAAKSFSDVLPLKTPDLLPISFQNHLYAFSAGLLIAWVLTLLILYLLPLRTRTMPDDLLD
ncbi:MAG: ABC transporter permease [Candidatus Magnetomorum sp.]|nr:ABC transporter permease [Candidatus Magnetomorum sp.]